MNIPVNHLPYPLPDFILGAAKAMGCDPAFIALPALVAAGAAIGNTRRIALSRIWSEPAVLWGAIVAPSGTMKSPAQELALKPLHERQRKIIKDHKAAFAEYESDRRAWKAKPRDDRGDEPTAPEPMEHPLVSDITVEALADRLEATPRGTLVAVDELAGWLGSFDQYKGGKGGDLAAYLSMHRAGPLKVDRKTGDRKTLYVPHAAVSIIGGVQSRIFRRLLTAEYFDCGLAARLLLVMPPVVPKKWTDAELSQEIEEAYAGMFDKLYEFQPTQVTDGSTFPALVHMDEGAKAAWVEFYDVHNQEQADFGESEIGAAWSKLEGYAARLALVIHGCRQAGGEKVDPWHVDEQSILAGVEWATWFGEQTKLVYRAFKESDEERERRELLDMVYKLGSRVTSRELQRHCRRYATADEAELALQALVDSGEGDWDLVKPDGRGRSSYVFCLAASPDRPPVDAVDADRNTNSSGKTAFVSTSTLSTGLENEGGGGGVE
ncbi:MAG: YfjI family protein [Planctomycetota bacterium]|nr:YfjI family protein [Planctomycetota bacterium]